ncbi:hypothetical protein PMAYCL1PPCAC_22043, partial [Pristionchus mayeri]
MHDNLSTSLSLTALCVSTKEMSRKCLVCDTSITRVQMGIDACRACAAFYRRARRSTRKFRCKGSSCAQAGPFSDCRSCRYDRMKALFDQANEEIKVSPRTKPVIRCPSCAPSTSNNETSNSNETTPVLDRLRRGYDVMTRIRKTAELSIRPEHSTVHPSASYTNDYPHIYSTHRMKIRTKKILVSALFDFASIAFPGFDALNEGEQWRLISGNCTRIDVLESIHRSSIIYPDDSTMFTSYTTTKNLGSFDLYLSDCNLNVNADAAKKELKKNMTDNVRKVKRHWQRIAPTDDELLVMLAIAFWSTGDESLCRLATTSRNELMKDVHTFYTQKGLTDYATRIGELYCLLAENERITNNVSEDYTLLGLMNNEDVPI